MKDNFSAQSSLYATFRPTYPRELYDFLLLLTNTKQMAWDCGSGNGQVARELSKYFDKVFATDISEQQLKQAYKSDNIFYSLSPAEKTSFASDSFDLITVAQAIHWFNFDAFYGEVKRTIKPGGILAVIGYGLFTMNEATDKVVNYFYEHIINDYWDAERKYIDEHYTTIPFPFQEIKSPEVFIQFEWTLEQLTGYLNTWSAVQHYIKAHNTNPVDIIYPELQKLFAVNKKQQGYFPVLLRTAVIEKT